MTTTLAQYTLLQGSYQRRLDSLTGEGLVAREVDHFRNRIAEVTSGEELVDDYRLYAFAMKAFGLGSEIFARGLMRKVFAEGVADPKAMANRLVDPKYREIAAAFGFAETSNLKMLSTRNREEVVSRYLRQELEERAGESNQGVRLALYFERRAPNIESWYEVLGDPALAEVTRTLLGLPPEFALTSVDRQAAYFEERLKLADLKDPEKLGDLIERFTAQWDLAGGGATSDPLAGTGIAPVQPLTGGASPIVSIDPALLAQLSQYKI